MFSGDIAEFALPAVGSTSMAFWFSPAFLLWQKIFNENASILLHMLTWNSKLYFPSYRFLAINHSCCFSNTLLRSIRHLLQSKFLLQKNYCGQFPCFEEDARLGQDFPDCDLKFLMGWSKTRAWYHLKLMYNFWAHNQERPLLQ